MIAKRMQIWRAGGTELLVMAVCVSVLLLLY